MQDDMIVELFWKRDESALSESEAKYSGYLKRIAMNIIANLEDAKEVVNETLFRAWNSIPPQRPDILRTYLGKIARELSLDRYRADSLGIHSFAGRARRPCLGQRGRHIRFKAFGRGCGRLFKGRLI